MSRGSRRILEMRSAARGRLYRWHEGGEPMSSIAEHGAAQGPAPRTPLTRERVLQTALDLADTSGIASLTIRRLAEQVGVEAMSLYYHVANKEAILDGVVDL